MENKTDKFISACAASDGIYSRGSCGVRVRYPIGRSRAWVELRARRQSLLPDRRSWCRTDEARCVGAVLGNAEGHKWSKREGREVTFLGSLFGQVQGLYRVYSYPWKQEVRFLLWRGPTPATDPSPDLFRSSAAQHAQDSLNVFEKVLLRRVQDGPLLAELGTVRSHGRAVVSCAYPVCSVPKGRTSTEAQGCLEAIVVQFTDQEVGRRHFWGTEEVRKAEVEIQT